MAWKLKYRCKACGYEAEVYEGRGLFRQQITAMSANGDERLAYQLINHGNVIATPSTAISFAYHIEVSGSVLLSKTIVVPLTVHGETQTQVILPRCGLVCSVKRQGHRTITYCRCFQNWYSNSFLHCVKLPILSIHSFYFAHLHLYHAEFPWLSGLVCHAVQCPVNNGISWPTSMNSASLQIHPKGD